MKAQEMIEEVKKGRGKKMIYEVAYDGKNGKEYRETGLSKTTAKDRSMNTMKKDLASARNWHIENGSVIMSEFNYKNTLIRQRIADVHFGDYEEGKHNAELIVRAVNNFDALLEACKEAIAYCPEPLRLKLITAIANAEK